MFPTFRRFLSATERLDDGIRAITAALTELCAVQRELGPASERLEALELSRHQFEAQCEGLMLKAEGKLRAANNSEARERQIRKTYEHLIDPLAQDGDEQEPEPRDPVRQNDVPASEAERVHAMRVDVAPTNKALAQRAKFGVR